MFLSFPGGSVIKNLPPNAGDARDAGLIPGWGRAPGGGNSNPLHYSFLRNSTDRGGWWATVCGVEKSRTQLSDCVCVCGLVSITFVLHVSSILVHKYSRNVPDALYGDVVWRFCVETGCLMSLDLTVPGIVWKHSRWTGKALRVLIPPADRAPCPLVLIKVTAKPCFPQLSFLPVCSLLLLASNVLFLFLFFLPPWVEAHSGFCQNWVGSSQWLSISSIKLPTSDLVFHIQLWTLVNWSPTLPVKFKDTTEHRINVHM